ncbi:hypothetical protein A8F94_21520 [Bacillus sp. FJAT-27225]|uniref:hypothetical protein n=1 Tax=Bacillus sp. FJAT-27225 TaxID=1743144 RepID=UPI00080C2E48|nr:hypothetical protein [Bacillus sp. FJAT-27225]OCA81462.1 hypothetical protein A8F94_21520 [Bacillus sp. FJAT-27225]
MVNQDKAVTKEYLLDMSDHESYRVMNQRGVKQCVLPSPSVHNASWDALLTSEGELYLSLCSELTTSEYAKLAKYDYQKNKVEELFYTKELIFSNERVIRDSKIHTSLAQLGDGRLIMLTHTTDKSPNHPAWMPNAYYNHPWEGYPGSSLILYDPVTEKAENYGIPVHRETLYGGTYDAVKNAYYALGYLKGHLYRIDLDDRQVTDYGQVVEKASYRLIVGSDGNIYFTSRNGVLMRVNVETQQVENLRHTLPNSSDKYRRNRSYMTYGVNGPDGRLYMSGMFHDELSAYDPKTDHFEVIGRYKQPEFYIKGIENNDYIGAMDFDANGVLYYIVCGLRQDQGEDFKLGSSLMCWDILKGKAPEFLGLAGTESRVTTSSCSLFIDKGKQILYIVSTNHGNDAPDVIAVDLPVYKEKAYELGPVTQDPFVYQDNKLYEEHGESIRNTRIVWDTNPFTFTAKSVIPVALWKDFSDEEVFDSGVKKLVWNSGNLEIYTGEKSFYQHILDESGKIVQKNQIGQIEVEPPANLKLELPYYPGRQYQAVVDKMIPINGERHFIATKDGMLAIRDGRNVYALGPACSNGPVHDLTVTKDGKKVYGVAGDIDGFSIVFEYSNEKGLRWLGTVATDNYQYGCFNSPNLTSIALNESDTILAIGSGGRMGSVYLYSL